MEVFNSREVFNSVEVFNSGEVFHSVQKKQREGFKRKRENKLKNRAKALLETRRDAESRPKQKLQREHIECAELCEVMGKQTRKNITQDFTTPNRLRQA